MTEQPDMQPEVEEDIVILQQVGREYHFPIQTTALTDEILLNVVKSK